MKNISLFSGIGAFEKAIDNLEVPCELVGFSEIDKYAVKSYCAIHNVDESKNLGDITKIDENSLPKDLDLITYGFPCQDISLAGKQKGLFNEDGTQTRSGLFFEALRIIEATKPKVAIAENVKNLTSKKFNAQFQIVLASLEAAGYNNYYKVLNAKDYGIPQNRERVFIVSIRKDIDTGFFQFPEGFPLELRLKDMLEAEVDEKYYLSDKGVAGILNALTDGREHKPNILSEETEYAPTIDTRVGAQTHRSPYISEPEVMQIGNCCPTKTRENPNQGRIYDTEGLAPCLNQMGGGNRQPFVTVREATKKGYAEAFEGDSINLEQPNSTTRRGRVGKQVAQTLTTSPQQAVVEPVAVWDGFNQRVRADSTVVGTLTQNCGADLKRNGQGILEASLRIRKLTPKECFRLMGFADEDFEKAAYYSVEEVENLNLRSSKKHKDLPLDEKIERVSNTQLYKQAGNSIVVPVVEYIIKALLDCGALEKNVKEKKEMELKVKTPTFPEVIDFNFEELKKEITERASNYVNLVYTDDQIQDAKKDRATLNKFVKALSDERIKIKKECMKPYDDFEKKIKELDGIVNQAIKNIDEQVKNYEKQQKADKLAIIKGYWNSCEKPFEIAFEKVLVQEWLNASTTLKSIYGAIDAFIEKTQSDLETLSKLPKFSFEAVEVYKTSLDMNMAISEGHRLAEIQRRKAEQEAARKAAAEAEAKKQAEAEAKAQMQAQAEMAAIEAGEAVFNNAPDFSKDIPEPKKEWISFKALLTVEDAQELKAFFELRNIEFKAV